MKLYKNVLRVPFGKKLFCDETLWKLFCRGAVNRHLSGIYRKTVPWYFYLHHLEKLPWIWQLRQIPALLIWQRVTGASPRTRWTRWQSYLKVGRDDLCFQVCFGIWRTKRECCPHPRPNTHWQAHGVTGQTSPVNQILNISEKTIYTSWFIQNLRVGWKWTDGLDLFLFPLMRDYHVFYKISTRCRSGWSSVFVLV